MKDQWKYQKKIRKERVRDTYVEKNARKDILNKIKREEMEDDLDDYWDKKS